MNQRWNVLQVLQHDGGNVVARVEREGEVLLLKSFAGSGAEELIREVDCMRRLTSPFVTQIIEAGTNEDGTAYLLREFVEGQSLRQALEAGERIDPAEVLDAVLQGLQALHDQGLYHGDIKPENVLLPVAGPVAAKLSDFGLGGVVASGAPVAQGVQGSAYYLPPERLFGWPLTAHSDLFALAVLIHELCGGHLPKDPAAFYAAFPRQALTTCLPAVEMDAGWRSLQVRLGAVDPGHRPASVAEVQDELARLRSPTGSGERPSSRPVQLPRDLSNQALRRELEGLVEAGESFVARVAIATLEDRELLRRQLSLLAVSHALVFEEVPRAESWQRPGPRSLTLAPAAATILADLGVLRVRQREAPVLRVILVAEGEPATSQPVRDWLIDLAPPALRVAEVGRHLQQSTDSKEAPSLPVQRLAEELVRRAQGSVRRCNRLLAELARRGLVSAGGTGVQLHALEIPWPAVEASLREQRVVTGLSAKVQEVFQVLQLADEGVSEPLLRRLCQQEKTGLLSLRSELEPRGLLECLGGRWQVPMPRASGEEELVDERRHRWLATCLVQEGELGAALWHLVLGRDTLGARRLLRERVEELGGREADRLPLILDQFLELEAGQRLPSEVLYAVARLFYRAGRIARALEPLEELRRRRSMGEELKCKSLRLLGASYSLLSRLDDARKTYAVGHRRTLDTAAEVPFVHGLADVALRQGEAKAALSVLDGLQRRGTSLTTTEELELQGIQAQAHYRLGDLTSARRVLREAIARARGANEPAHLAALLTNLWLVLRQEGKRAEAVDAMREALALQEERGQVHELAGLHNNLGVSLKDMLSFTEARHHLSMAVELRQALGDARGAGISEVSLGLLELDRGRLGRARAHLVRADELLHERGQARERLVLETSHLRLRLLTGQRRGWTRALLEVRRRGRDEQVFEVVVETSLLLIQRLLLGRRLEAAHAEILRTEEELARKGGARDRQRLLLEKSLFQRCLGDSSSARRLLEHLTSGLRGTTLESELELQVLALEAPPVDGSLLASVERSVRSTDNRLARLELEHWRMAWSHARGDHHGVAASERACDELLHEIDPGEEDGSRRRIVATTLARRRPLLRACIVRSQRCDEREESMASNQPPRESWELLRTFLTINKRLGIESDSERLLEYIVDTGLALAAAQRGFLILESQEAIEVEVHRSLRGGGLSDPEKELSQSFLQAALESGRPIVTSNAGTDPRFRERKSVSELDLRSVLCVPFRVDEETRGALYLDNPLREGVFGDRELELIDALADQAALALRNLRSRQHIEDLNQKLQHKVRKQGSQLELAKRRLDREGLVESDKPLWLGQSPRFLEVTRLLQRFAATDLAVLITGETGTGKELAARQLHASSARRDGPFVSESCSAIPETLLETEFFGVKKGAFTGADKDRPGLFELAHGGTLFLDELGDLPSALQVKLLRALQEGRVRPVGATESVPVDVRIVCATHRDLLQMIRDREFREDLYYRVAAAHVELPPLRDRREDVVLLAEYFLDQMNVEHERDLRLDADARQALEAYSWPGNVRQLQNEIQRGFALADGSQLAWSAPREDSAAVPGTMDWSVRADLTLRDLEQESIEEALRRASGNRESAARLLGISRASIYERCRRFGIRPGSGSRSEKPG